MKIQSNNNLNFRAKFVPNQSYFDVFEYAFEHNKSDKLRASLNNIDRIRKDTYIKMDICYTEDFPTIVFSRYERGWNKETQEQTDEYILKRQVDYVSSKKENPLKFALNRLIKLGNDAPNNKMFQEVVINKDISKKRYSLF